MNAVKDIGTYYNFWQCGDFKGACVNTPKLNYDISKNSHTLFLIRIFLEN